MRNYTDITVVLDRSGSMQSVKEDTIGGFDSFIEEQKKLPGTAKLTLVQFDDQYEVIHEGALLSKVPSIGEFYQPRGSTALLDAIGRTITATEQRLGKLSTAMKPKQVLFVVITDGEENASKEIVSKSVINNMIQSRRDNNKWQFVFIGANQDAIKEGGALGVMSGSTFTYDSSSKGTRHMYNVLSASTRGYRVSGQAVNSNFFDPSSSAGSPPTSSTTVTMDTDPVDEEDETEDKAEKAS